MAFLLSEERLEGEGCPAASDGNSSFELDRENSGDFAERFRSGRGGGGITSKERESWEESWGRLRGYDKTYLLHLLLRGCPWIFRLDLCERWPNQRCATR